MTIEQALEIMNTSQPGGHHSKDWSKEEIDEAHKVILQDTYEFLESENFHTSITVIEKLTGIEFK